MVRKLTSTAVWILLALGALGGIGTIGRILNPSPAQVIAPQEAHAETAVALHAAKVWLTWTKGETVDQRKKALEAYWPNLDLPNWVPPAQNQTPRELYVREVSRPEEHVVVVSVDAWSEVSDGQTTQTRHQVLNVPVLRTDSGYTVAAPPTILPPPALGKKPASMQTAPQEVYEVARPFLSDFMRAYLTSSNPTDLANMVTPGVKIQPMGGWVQFQQVSDLKIYELGKGRYEAAVTVDVRDPATQTVLPEQFLVSFLRDEKGRLEVDKIQLHGR